MFKMQNLISIYNKLLDDDYKQGNYNIFMIKSPKYRIVMSLDISDKIVNHYVARFILMPKLERYLDFRNVATRKDLGRDFGIKLVKKYLEYYKGKECYVLKLDISKYFYSIDHGVLKAMLKDKFSNLEYKIVCNIIDSTNQNYINDSITKLKNNELKYVINRKEEILEIPFYEYGKGLPIGNMTSQFLSIFYLHELDHKIIHDYHLKRMIRYMDDIIIFSSNRDYLKNIKIQIEDVLNKRYLLKLNKKKSSIVNVKDGFNFCGYRFRIIDNKTVINVCSDTKKRVKKRIKEVKYLYNTNKIPFKVAFSSINTYYNGFKYGSNANIKRMVDKYFFG